MPVLLVRHAKAGSRGDWNRDDAFRPLSSAGRAQAEALVPVLQPYGPSLVLSSPFTRCVQTVEPLAAACDLKVIDEPALAEGHTRLALALVRRLIVEHGGTTVVCCTHGDIVPEVLQTVVEEDGIEIAPESRWQKGSTWVLRAERERFVTAEYLAPPR